VDNSLVDVNVHPSKKIVKFSNDKAIYRQLKDSIDEFFYHNDRENWQPNIDLLKQNINVENKDEKISSLFSDEIVKTDSQKFFSFETHDGNFDVVNSDVNKEENVMVETETEKNYSAEESQDVNPEVAKEEAASKEIMSANEENLDFSVSYNEKENEKQDSVMPEVRGEYFQKAEKEERYANFNIEKSSEGYKVGTFEKHEGRQFDYNILGQIFDTYILVRKNDELEIYDQHIIHERILYEELKDKFYNKKLDSQQLLIPQKIEVTAVEKSIILENQETFSEFGFDIDQFSDNEMLLRAVPAFDFREDVKNVFHKLSLQISERVQKDRPAFFFDMQLPLRKFLRDGRNLTSVAQNVISPYRKLQSEKTVFFRLIPSLFRKISLIDLFRHRTGKKHTRFNKRNLIIALSLLHTELRQLLSF